MKGPEILNNSIVHKVNLAVVRGVWMSVDEGDTSVSSPSRMSDSHRTWYFFGQNGLKFLDLADRFVHRNLVTIMNGNTG